MRSLSADLYLVGIFQLAAITAATMVLALAVHKATRSVVLAASVGGLLFLNAPYASQAMQLMSEGLYAPLVTFALAAMLLLAATRSLVAAASFGVLAAYALATRPVGYSLLALIPFFWFTRRADAWKPVLAAAVSAALVCALLAYVNFSLRGLWGFQQFTGP